MMKQATGFPRTHAAAWILWLALSFVAPGVPGAAEDYESRLA